MVSESVMDWGGGKPAVRENCRDLRDIPLCPARCLIGAPCPPRAQVFYHFAGRSARHGIGNKRKDHFTPNHQLAIFAKITGRFGISASDGLGAIWRDTVFSGTEFPGLGATTQGVRQRGMGRTAQAAKESARWARHFSGGVQI